MKPKTKNVRRARSKRAADPIFALVEQWREADRAFNAIFRKRDRQEGKLPSDHPARGKLVQVMIDDRYGADTEEGLRQQADAAGVDAEPYIFKFRALTERKAAARRAVGIDDAAVDAARERFFAAERRLARSQPTTLAGLAVKVKLLCAFAKTGDVRTSTADRIMARTLPRDLKRLLGKGGAA